ncbi:MAG TPA: hypothetical protein DDY14_06730, partial [Chromatiaceae bacterium]|nr:hypothetical protein [Chromatiaceae bacterium]
MDCVACVPWLFPLPDQRDVEVVLCCNAARTGSRGGTKKKACAQMQRRGKEKRKLAQRRKGKKETEVVDIRVLPAESAQLFNQN